MKHFGEVLQTLGASNVETLDEKEHWDFWKAVYSTPVSEISGCYLYLKSSCPWKEGDNERNWIHWTNLSGGSGYELIVAPKSKAEFLKRPEETKRSFKGTKVRTSKQLLLDNVVRNLQWQPVKCEEYFIDPTLEVKDGKKIQDTTRFLVSWVKGGNSTTNDTSIAALIAHGGVGKTTVSRVLSQQLHEDDPAVIPILIESEQWRHLLNTSISLSSLWDLAISRRFQNATRLLSNETAFRVLVREGVFVIIFDGFDELCVNSYSTSRPQEIIRELKQLLSPEDGPVQAKVVLTARKTFWDAVTDDIEPKDIEDIEVFNLRGFDQAQRKSYFQKRLSDPIERDSANRISSQIGGGIYEGVEEDEFNYDRLSGAPFVLDLIAQYVHDNGDIDVNPYQTDPLGRLLEDVCRRENRRQSLGIEPSVQLTVFEELFREHQETITLDDLRDYLNVISNVTDSKVAERFSSHPFLIRAGDDTFVPRYDVLRVYFVARFLANSLVNVNSKTPRRQIMSILAKNSTGKTQVIEYLVSQLRKIEPTHLVAAIHHALDIINEKDDPERKPALAALFHVVTSLIRNTDKEERTRSLGELYRANPSDGHLVFNGLAFSSLFRSFDLGRTTFIKCDFTDVEFKNCIFSEQSLFDSCKFDGSLSFINCSNPAAIQTESCSFSREAEYAFDKMRGSASRPELRRSFAEEALLRALRKFRRDNHFISIQDQHRKTGFKPANPYNDSVWEELRAAGFIQEHFITGVTGGGWKVAEDKDIRREVSSFLDNGVLGKNLTYVLKRMIG